ncbi:Uncharacterised protein [Vibrio cholerae]|nr:Uncharacterised protein [Vibrio cholerae]
MLSRHDQIAFIFTIFIIHQDDHFALTNVFNDLLWGANWHDVSPIVMKPLRAEVKQNRFVAKMPWSDAIEVHSLVDLAVNAPCNVPIHPLPD